MMNRKVKNITKWRFAKMNCNTMEEALYYEQAVYENVTIPHTWYQYDDYYRGIAVYRTNIECRLSDEEEAYLEFQGADQWCKVYCNQHYAGEHKGGYSTFRIPIKKGYIEDGQLEIIVLLDNRNSGAINPIFGDFTVFGGLYREVTLIIVSENHFDLMYYGTSGVLVNTVMQTGDIGKVIAIPNVCVSGDIDKSVIRYELYDETHKLVLCEEAGIDQTSELVVEKPVLWDGKGKGHLYLLRAMLLCNEKLYDTVEIQCGFRSISLDSETGFWLNGKNIKINGVAKHQDFEDVFCASGRIHQEKDIELIKEIGANAVRLSHYQHPQLTYNLCDKEGLIVWAEIPMLKMTENEMLIENAKEQLKELILQNMHHPCICFWGIQNEIAMFRDTEYMHQKCRELNELVKQLDPFRLSACANLHGVEAESELNSITDMVGYNLYFGWYYGKIKDYGSYLDEFHRKKPDTALGITEYGVDCNLEFHSTEPKVKDYSEEFQSLFHENVYPILESKPYLWGNFIWNMFDFSSAIRNEGGIKYRNCKGLVTYDRKEKKDSFYYYKARWSDEPFLHIAEKRYQKRNSRYMTVKVYSNMGTVSLYVNGELADTKEEDQKGIFLFQGIKLDANGICIEAISGALSQTAVFYYTESPVESYKYKEAGSGAHVKNWFLDEAVLETGNYCVKDTIDDLLKSEKAMAIVEEYLPQDIQRMREDGGTLTLLTVLGFVATKYENLNIDELNRRLNEIEKL